MRAVQLQLGDVSISTGLSVGYSTARDMGGQNRRELLSESLLLSLEISHQVHTCN